MVLVRTSGERGHFDHGWLDTYHTFSFGDYRDPEQMGFRDLRVINEDRVRPGKGFPMHPHRDMEILTWILEGTLEHIDSMGNGSVLRAGEIQRMTAGTGVTHSEFNHSSTESVHFLQIWILPEKNGLTPGYQQEAFPERERRGTLRLAASADGRDRSVTVHQDVKVYLSLLEPGQRVVHSLDRGRFVWVQVARGDLSVNGAALRAGDGAAVSGEEQIELQASTESDILLFDLS